MNGRTSSFGRFFVLLGLASVGVGLFAVGCDDDSGGNGYAYGGGASACSQLTTCGSCTPVSGCGWCEDTAGQGLCASDPDQCANVSAFSWTWDPSGCRVAADASATGVSTPTSDASSPIEVLNDASTPVGTPVDAGPGTPTDAAINPPVDAGTTTPGEDAAAPDAGY